MAELTKIRAKMDGNTADIKVLITHIMETGQRKDAKTGQIIPAHFIQNVTAALNGKTVLSAEWSVAIAKNPFLGFKAKGAKTGDKIVISWEDNKGNKDTAEETIK
jgi:sulfur-oxidizing protein SoxZ